MVSSIQAIAPTAYQPSVGYVGQPQSKPDTPVNDGRNTEKVTISPAVGIQLGQDQSIEAGKLVKQTDQVLAKQQDTLGKMNTQLQGVLKQFPPYGAEDPQRIAYLKSFSGLRQEIESLQFPRNTQAEQGLPKGVGLPTQNMGVHLPDLSGASVSDKQIADAARQVQAAIVQVQGQRADLTNSVITALGGSDYTDKAKSLG